MRLPLALILVAACGGDDGVSPDASTTDASGTFDAPGGCMRTPAPADRPRFVVVSHPYSSGGAQAASFEVIQLSATGTLTRPQPQITFTLASRAVFGTVEFTPDGEVGLVALDDGKLGVFKIDASGAVTVVEAGFDGSFYARRVVIDPRGDRAWIVDPNTRENGGGIYLVTIGCDGTVADRGLVAAASLPGALVFTADGRAAVAARDILGSMTAGDDVHLVQWGDSLSAQDGVDAFGDDDAIIGGSALTHDGGTLLVGDTSGFSNVPNRVAVVGVGATSLTPLSVVTPLDDPEAIASSPFGDVAIVTSAFGDAIFVLDTGGAAGAWRIRGEVSYVQGDPMLPGDVATISRGVLRGHVLVAENLSIRHLAFGATGQVTDLGSFAFGSGSQNIVGVIGVTP